MIPNSGNRFSEKIMLEQKLVRAAGLEPATSWFQARSAAGLRHALKVDHPAGLEPATSRPATGCSAPAELWMGIWCGDGDSNSGPRRERPSVLPIDDRRRLAPVAGIEPAYSPLNRRRRAPCSALTGMVEHRGNAPRATSLQGRSEPLLVSLTLISGQV